MRNDLFLFIGLLIVLFAVWVHSGGPSRPISFAGPYLNPITQTGTTAQAYGDPNQYQSIQGTSWMNWGGTGTNVPASEASEYRDVVMLSRDTSGAVSTNEDTEYLYIQTGFRATKPISLAGWKLVSKETGQGVTIPAGAEIAQSGRVNTLTAITLAPGDQAIVTSGRSPVGVSFKESMCTGYLAERQKFVPDLARSCPSASAEYGHADETDDACLTYVRTIPQCATKATYGSEPNSCDDFVDDHLNYNACVANHKDETGFLGRTWRVYLGANDELWRKSRETIMLLDAKGKVVDAMSY